MTVRCKLLTLSFAIIAVHCASIGCEKNSTNIDDILKNLSSNSTTYLNQSVLYNVTRFHLIADLVNVTIKGPANVTCAQGVGLVFVNITDFVLDGIIIQRCGLTGDNLSVVNNKIQTEVANTSYQFQSEIKVGMFIIGSVNITFHNVIVKETQGIGVVCVNNLGLVTFNNVTFVNNRPTGMEACYKCLFPFVLNEDQCLYNPASVSGSLLLLYANNRINHSSADAHVSITKSYFIDNFSCTVANIFNALAALYPSLSQAYRNATATGGIKIVLSQDSNDYGVNVEVISSMFKNNTAFSGSAINVEVFNDVHSNRILVRDCTFSENGMAFANVTTYGGSISVTNNIHPFYPTASFLLQINFSVGIQNCSFMHNFATVGGAIIIFNVFSSNFYTHISDTHFENNSAVFGNCIYLSGTSMIDQFISLIIEKSSFVNNSVIEDFSFDNSRGSHGAVYLRLTNAKCSDTVFTNNIGSAVNLISSSLTLDGQVVFDNNRGFDGGALYLQASRIIIANNSEVLFANNSALSVGGAIYYDSSYLGTEQVHGGCFLYFSTYNPYCQLTNSCYSKEMNISVDFINNTAAVGSTLFGFSLECPWLYDLGYNSSLKNENLLDFINNTYGDVLTFIPNITADNVVSTKSRSINVNSSSITIIPGQIVTLGLNASDFFQRSVVTVVSATTLSHSFSANENYSVTIAESGFQLLQKNLITPTQIQINGTKNSEVDFAVFSLTSSARAQIRVKFNNCPTFGFCYNMKYHACVCDPDLESKGVSCDYRSVQLTKPQRRWIGELDRKAIVLSCLFDYCSDTTSVDPNNLNEQCTGNRAGVLCGGCKEGYGINIGLRGCSNDCSGARNVVLWLLGLLVYTFWVVITTAFLHLYVSDGFLYGFIFYHNTLYIFREVFFHSPSVIQLTFSSNQFLLYSPNTCLYEEITPLTTSALRFVLPMFVFFFMGIAIVLARRFNIFNRRSLFSITKTFATLLYINYNWLLDTSFNLLMSLQIKTPAGTNFRWRIDPNVIYFDGWHAALGVMSLLVILILSITALVLLLPGVAYRFKLVQKLKPLIDAYHAPFKLEYSFWIGMQLLMRIILYIVLIFVPQRHQLYFVGIIILLLLIAQTTILPYKEISFSKFKNLRNFLDNLFLFFLLAHIIEVSSFRNVFVLSSICYIITAVMYICLVLFYFFKRFPRLRKLLIRTLCCARQKDHQDFGNLTSETNSENDDITALEFTKSVRTDYVNVASSSINVDPHDNEIPEAVNYAEFRESLLRTDYYDTQ